MAQVRPFAGPYLHNQIAENMAFNVQFLTVETLRRTNFESFKTDTFLVYTCDSLNEPALICYFIVSLFRHLELYFCHDACSFKTT